MAAQTKSALQRLSSLSQSLNQVSDELSEQLAEIEKAINRFGLGVTASVTLSTSGEPYGNPPTVEVEKLRYGKNSGKWGLSWVQYKEHDPDATWDEKPLREAPRDVRLLAVKMLPHLLDELAKNSEELAAKAATRVQEAREMAAALSQK